MYGVTEHATKWIVNLKRGGKSIARTFAFSTHGGREVASTQAQAWRDEQIHRHPQPERRELAQRIKRNDISGVPGVLCQCWPDGRPMRWIAHTQIAKGVILTKSFGVKTHGYEQAKQMAIAAREQQLAQMTGRISLHPADDVDPEASVSVAQIRHEPRITKSGIAGVTLTYSKQGQPQSWMVRTGHRRAARSEIVRHCHLWEREGQGIGRCRASAATAQGAAARFNRQEMNCPDRGMLLIIDEGVVSVN